MKGPLPPTARQLAAGPCRGPGASWTLVRPVITDRVPRFGPAQADLPRGRRIAGRALARPSLPALLGLLLVVVVFAVQDLDLLTWGGLATVLDTAALLGIGGVAVALLLIAGQFDL
jgi:simple sugar transport system permease protein